MTMADKLTAPTRWIPLLERQELTSLEERRKWGALSQAVTNILLVVSLSILCVNVQSVFVWIPVWWLQAIVLSGFLGAAHDCAHGTFARTRRMNHVLGSLWSSAVLFNFSLYKYYHLEHHHHTTVDGDTEPLGSFRNLREYLAALPMFGFFVPFWVMSLRAFFGSYPHFVRTSVAKRDVRADNWVLLAWFGLIIAGAVVAPAAILIGYIAPLAFYFPMVFWTSIPEHYGCEEGSNPFRNTRSLSGLTAFRWVFWNGNYHAEHHYYPRVPSYNLPRLHALIGQQFEFRERSYVAFHLKVMWRLFHSGDREGPVLRPLERIQYEDIHESEASDSLPPKENALS